MVAPPFLITTPLLLLMRWSPVCLLVGIVLRICDRLPRLLLGQRLYYLSLHMPLHEAHCQPRAFLRGSHSPDLVAILLHTCNLVMHGMLLHPTPGWTTPCLPVDISRSWHPAFKTTTTGVAAAQCADADSMRLTLSHAPVS